MIRWPWHRRRNHIDAEARRDAEERAKIRARLRAQQMQLRLIELRRDKQ